MDGKWNEKFKENVYDNQWVKVDLYDVKLPDKTTIEHHIVQPQTDKTVSVICINDDDKIMMIWRHRFITGSWGWELPGGFVEDEESVIKAAEREFQEETGWQIKEPSIFFNYFPWNGLVQVTESCVVGKAGEFLGPGRDTNEAADIAWLSFKEIEEKILAKGEFKDISCGPTLIALLVAKTQGLIK